MSDLERRKLERDIAAGDAAAVRRLEQQQDRDGIWRMIDLRELIQVPPADVSVDSIEGDAPHVGWLRAFLGGRAEILSSESIGDYEGESFALLRMPGRLILWRDSFGSCSGCDHFEEYRGRSPENDAKSLEYLRATMQEGNTKQFPNAREALKWLNEISDRDFAHLSWRSVIHIFQTTLRALDI